MLAVSSGLLISLNSLAQPLSSWSFSHKTEAYSTRGLIDARHWLGHGLRESPQNVWAAYRSETALSAAVTELKPLTLSVSAHREAYFSGNGNVLYVAARAEKEGAVEYDKPGVFAGQGRFFDLDATRIQLSGRRELPLQGAWLSLAGYFDLVREFQTGSVDALLQTQGTQSSLRGTLNRIGTRSYGPLERDRPDEGYGFGLNLEAGMQLPGGAVTLGVNNLLSQLRFDSIHYSERRYQVVEKNGRLIPGELPALTGRYGVTSKTLSMPRHWSLSFAPAVVPGLNLALLGLGNQTAAAVRQSMTFLSTTAWVQTVNGQNFSLGLSHRWGDRAEAGIAVTANRTDQPLLSMLTLGLRW